MDSKLIQARLTGCFSSLVFRILITLVVLGGFAFLALIVTALPLPAGWDRDARALILVGCIALFFVVSMAVTLAWGITSILNRAHRLDEAFLPFGLRGKSYLTVGRQYHGALQGRRIDVYFYRGPVLEIILETPIRTRLGITQKERTTSILAGFMGRTPLTINDPRFNRLTLFANDEDWAYALLANRQVSDLILNLAAENPQSGSFELRQLLFEPGSLMLRLYHTREESITPENVRSWLGSLQELAQVIQNLPPPSVMVDETPLQHTSRTNRNAYSLPAALFVLTLIGVPTLCLLAAFAVLFWLDK